MFGFQSLRGVIVAVVVFVVVVFSLNSRGGFLEGGINYIRYNSYSREKIIPDLFPE